MAVQMTDAREQYYWSHMKTHFEGAQARLFRHSLAVDYGALGDTEMFWVVRDALRHKPRLTNLMLKGCSYGDAGVRVLARGLLRGHATLETVELHVNAFTGRCMGALVDALVTMPRLSAVKLDSVAGLGDGALPALLRLVARAPRLATLSLRDTGLSVAAQRRLATACERSFTLTSLGLDMLEYGPAAEHDPWTRFVTAFTERNDAIAERLRERQEEQNNSDADDSDDVVDVLEPGEDAVIAAPPPTRAPKRRL